MIATLERYKLTEECAMGVLVIGEELFYTIERPWLDNKSFVSCIPEGEYRCVRYSSPRFPNTFEVTKVPGRSYILIHAGNYAHDVEGCIAIGLGRDVEADMVTHSQKAMEALRHATRNLDEFTLRIINKPGSKLGDE